MPPSRPGEQGLGQRLGGCVTAADRRCRLSDTKLSECRHPDLPWAFVREQ